MSPRKVDSVRITDGKKTTANTIKHAVRVTVGIKGKYQDFSMNEQLHEQYVAK